MNYAYYKRTIPKRDGTQRQIVAPSQALKEKQREILKELEKVCVHECCHGFVKGRSILSHASLHIGALTTIHIDLTDFFPSISFERVRGLFKYLSLPEEWALICCYQGNLVQGSPASPYIANLIAKKLDSRLQGLAQNNWCRYSRYADDIVFSLVNPCTDPNWIISQARKIIAEEDFYFKNEKLKVKHGQRRIITGILVGPYGLDVPSSTRQKYAEAIKQRNVNQIKGLSAFIEMVENYNKDYLTLEIEQ